MGYDNVDLVRFIYKPTTLEERASLSLHLTKREIIDISEAMKLEENQKSLSRLKELVKISIENQNILFTFACSNIKELNSQQHKINVSQHENDRNSR